MKRLSSIVLARGKSTRLKQDKAFLKIGPHSFLELIISKLKPLCAIYSKKCLKPMARQMQKGDFKIINFFSAVRVKVIKLTRLRWLKNPDAAGLININTPKDYRKTKEVFQQWAQEDSNL